MGDHVFVSYARADETYVEKLAEHLRAYGVEVWTDAAIDGGAKWAEAIQGKIDSCTAFVVVMSSAARRSDWVQREVLHAQRQRKKILPLLLSGEPFFLVNDIHYEGVEGGGMPSPRWVERLRAAASRSMTGSV